MTQPGRVSREPPQMLFDFATSDPKQVVCPNCGEDRLIIEYVDHRPTTLVCPACEHRWPWTPRLVRPERFTWKPGELELVERGVVDVVDEALDWMDAPDLRYEDGKPLLPDERA